MSWLLGKLGSALWAKLSQFTNSLGRQSSNSLKTAFPVFKEMYEGPH